MSVPITKFLLWWREAERAKIPLAEAVALATADRRGRPSARFVLLKDADERGFVFFTNARSRKGRELLVNPRAALVVYWDTIGKQARVEGRVREVSNAEADAYWESRPRESRLAALASSQSAPLRSRSELISRFRKLNRQFDGKPIPRPSWWTGYRIQPDGIEFWTRGEFRLHHRELFTRTTRGWKRALLNP